MTFDKLRLLLPLVRSGGDWVASIPEGRLSIWEEGADDSGSPHGFRWLVLGRRFVGEEWQQGGSAESLDAASGEVWEAVLRVREHSTMRRTDEVLPILRDFIEGPLRALLVDGASFSRFVELVNQAHGVRARYADLYPSWLFNARACWPEDAVEDVVVPAAYYPGGGEDHTEEATEADEFRAEGGEGGA